MTKPNANPHRNPLANWLRGANATQRNRLAVLCGLKTDNYLYQIAGERREPSVSLAFAIEDGTRKLHDESFTALPVVTAREVANIYALAGLEGS